MKTLTVRILELITMSFLLAESGYATVAITAVPFTITKSGTYILKADLTLSGTNQTAITVNAPNVVIDLKGFTLATSDTTFSNDGIVSNANNVTVQNGTITGFFQGVVILGFSQGLVQNLRLLNSTIGVRITGSSSVVQNCFIFGTGASGTFGVSVSSSTHVLVKNNQILNTQEGCASNGRCSFVANYIGNCTVGLDLGASDKYQGNVTNDCTTPFSGGTAVGDENN